MAGKAKTTPTTTDTTQKAGKAKTTPTFEWAINTTKLAAARRHTEDTLGLRAGTQEHHDAIKARYIELKGALREERGTAARGKAGRVVNLADHDGSADTEDDENDESDEVAE